MVLRSAVHRVVDGREAAVADDRDDLATDAQVVAVVQRGLLATLQALAVEVRAVAAVEVLDHELALGDVEAGVIPAAQIVVEAQPAVAHAADQMRPDRQGEGSSAEFNLELRHRGAMVPQTADAPQAPETRSGARVGPQTPGPAGTAGISRQWTWNLSSGAD
jgi:hypothetical protein